jgi:synaptosomal-associated protein 25
LQTPREATNTTLIRGIRRKVRGAFFFSVPAKSDFKKEEKEAKKSHFVFSLAQQLNDESSASLKRSLAIAHQTNQVAADTMVELDRQGRQIENMERDIEIIEDNNNQADRQLRSLKSVFGRMANALTKNRSYREESKVVPRETPDTVKNRTAPSRAGNNAQKSSESAQSIDLLQGNDAETERMRRQVKEQDQDLDELSGALGQMMFMAEDMNREINDQNQRLEKVGAGVEKQNSTIEKNNRRVKKML